MNKVLAPVDFSAVTDSVIESAVRLCKAFNSELVLVYVAQPHPNFMGCDFEKGQRWREVCLSDPGKDIVGYAEKADAAGVSVSIVVEQGPVVETILELSGAIAADWIVLGSHGHGALYDLLVGSTVEGVMSVSKVPVVIVPDTQK
ncbi:MAG: universal stress protein [Pseudomonadales bacterium]|nr:universal stress protein [Pseudomonadales bacterium]